MSCSVRCEVASLRARALAEGARVREAQGADGRGSGLVQRVPRLARQRAGGQRRVGAPSGDADGTQRADRPVRAGGARGRSVLPPRRVAGTAARARAVGGGLVRRQRVGADEHPGHSHRGAGAVTRAGELSV